MILLKKLILQNIKRLDGSPLQIQTVSIPSRAESAIITPEDRS